MLKEYIVSLKKDVDYDIFWNEIENENDSDSFVPSRRVEIVNNRDGSTRNCHYSLTDEEAETLRQDPRIYSVEIPPWQRDDVIIGLRGQQISNFTKTSSSSGDFVNWGLNRVNNPTNNYGLGLTSDNAYNYVLDGSGVDVVIQDSGIEVYHPEFTDDNGNTRVQQINWYTESGLAGTQSANHYRDFDGHGTHVAGIVAGKTFGWAKNSRIYSLKVSGLEGAGDSGTGISIGDCFDVIKLWHRNKPIDPATGFKRPTIVNMSWGYTLSYSSVTRVLHRGNIYTDATTTSNAAYRWTNYGLVNITSGGNFITNFRSGAVDVDIQELLDEGVHVVIAGGNNYHKIDKIDGIDYNNSFRTGGVDYTYHRGSSPLDQDAIKVGSIDSTAFSEYEDQKAHSSETGPGIDIWAPGANVVSCCSNTNDFSAVSYFKDSGFKQINLSGTSMASPQVCGVSALYLQLNPSISPASLKNWLIKSAVSNTTIYTSNLNNDYTNTRSLMGGTGIFLHNVFNIEKDVVLSGSISIINGAFNLIR
jgi:subtilisin family serine protease